MVLGDFMARKRIDPFEKMSKDILSNIEYNVPSEIDIYQLCRLYGMKVNYSLIPEDINYTIPHKKGRRGVINLCVRETEQEERESLTHEFSHLYIHQISQLSQSSLMIDKMESQAFKLASNILMPSKELLNIEVFPDLNTTYIIAEDIADYFNVTKEFAYKRLVYFNENYKFNKNEPFRRIPKEVKAFDPDIMYNLFDTPFIGQNKPIFKSQIRSIKEDVVNDTNKIVFLFDKTKLELR